MKVIKILKKIRDKYVIDQVNRITLPEFEMSEIKRYHIIFSGKVQHIGFRLEIEQLALKLQLSGWVKNLYNGDVEMEIQGMDNKINFLLRFMNSLKRIKIKRMDKKTIALLPQEQEFKII